MEMSETTDDADDSASAGEEAARTKKRRTNNMHVQNSMVACLGPLGAPNLLKVGGPEEVEGQYTCDQCDKGFSKQSSLARHKYEHSGEFPC